ncbi:BamA/TamA family outer membrane protein [Aurantibacter aestuarii]|uniref:POTRA domain-containing protein n=1 Tax=Aurantibacter aestuarii TaxID=1266046 RepID=A0A2T1NG19_9FLAO|nr:hypothetical protein [Aurantibacter aestuarii]PSG91701.1 hypothetical protein C7H52_00890 [Aurantibacter aestuarii]
MKSKLLLILIFHLQLSFSQKESVKITPVEATNKSVSDSITKEINKNDRKLEDVLYKKGFLNYTIIDSIIKGLQKNYIIKYNDRIKYLELTKDSLSNSQEFIKKFNTNENFYLIPFSNIEEVLEKISESIKTSGFLFTEVYLGEIKLKNKSTITAVLNISNQERKRQLDKIILKGYEKFPKGFLKNYLKYKLNKNINLKEIETKSERVLDLEFVEEIKSPELLFTRDSTTLYLYLKKKFSNSFDGFIGFNTDEETKKLNINGYLNLVLLNNLNYGERLEIKYKSDESEQKNFEATLDLPYLFSSPIGIEARLNIFNRDSVFTLSTTELKTYYLINQKFKTSLSYESTNSSNLSSNESFFVEDYDAQYITTAFEYRKRNLNSRILNTKTSIYLKLKNGNRNTIDRKTKQNGIELKLQQLFNLNDRNKIITKLESSKLFSNNYLINELYRFGGNKSIRGFNENSLEADFYNIIGIEYHYLLSPALSINSITDLGYLENTLLNTKTQIYGFGFGLSALTKAGVLKMNFANGKTKNDEFKFSNTKVHLSLNAFF